MLALEHPSGLVHFNKSLLGSESMMTRPFDSNMSNWQTRNDSSHNLLRKTDSAGLMVCTVNGTQPRASGGHHGKGRILQLYSIVSNGNAV